MSTQAKKTVVVLGSFSHEGLLTTLKAIGYEGRFFTLDKVGPKTWAKRAAAVQSLQDSNCLGATVIYLHTTLLLRASSREYRAWFEAILKSARSQKTIIFVFQDNLDGIFSKRHSDTREPMTLEQMEDELRTSFESSSVRLKVPRVV
jgi:hypothetical protein